jgi:hypothetical protein
VITDRGRAVVTGALDALRELPPHPVRSVRRPGATFRAPGAGRVRRKGQLTVLASHGPDAIVEEARALNRSVDIASVTLKKSSRNIVGRTDMLW